MPYTVKKGALTFFIVALVVFILFVGGCSVGCGYNNLVKLEEDVNSKWSQVENQYQRRADLVPNLVETVKGYAAHEEETLTAVIEARAKATQVNISVEDPSAQELEEYAAAQGELSQALGKLMAVAESYPDLKANENFLTLQAQLEGTENRIATERMRFNESVQQYNRKRRSFPRNITAAIFGFDAKEYFQADKGAENAPKVAF